MQSFGSRLDGPDMLWLFAWAWQVLGHDGYNEAA